MALVESLWGASILADTLSENPCSWIAEALLRSQACRFRLLRLLWRSPLNGWVTRSVSRGSLKGIWTDRLTRSQNQGMLGHLGAINVSLRQPWSITLEITWLNRETGGSGKHPDLSMVDSGCLLLRPSDTVLARQTWRVCDWTGLQIGLHVAGPIVSIRDWTPVKINMWDIGNKRTERHWLTQETPLTSFILFKYWPGLKPFFWGCPCKVTKGTWVTTSRQDTAFLQS